MYRVSEILEDYRADFLMRGCRSIKSLRSEINQLNAEWGMTPAREIGVRDLRNYQAQQIAAGRRPATINKLLAVLKAAFNLAAQNEILERVPRFPPRLRPDPPRQGFLEQADYEAIRAQLPDWGKWVLDFGWWSGWRKGEVLWLRRDEVQLEAKRVRLGPERSKNRHARPIPLMNFAFDAVRKAIEAGPDDGLVFHRKGRRISSTQWQLDWRDAAIRANRPHMLFHDLRRSVVRRLELSGVPRKTAMGWVGHVTESIYQRYSITTERDLLPAAERMLRYLDPETHNSKVVSIFSR